MAFILLAACAPSVASPSVVIEPLSVQAAQRAIDAATNTAQAAATQAGLATESRRATEEAVNDSQTATAFPLAMQNTQAAMTTTALPISVTQTAIVDGARIAQAQATAAQLSVTATAQYYAQQSVIDDQERQAARDRWWVVWWTTVIAWVLFLLTLVAWVFSRAVSNVVPLLARSIWIAMRPPELTTIIDQKPVELPPPKSRIEKWQDYVIAFCEFGEMAKCDELQSTEPFSERRFDLVGIERPMWEATLTWFMDAQLLTRVNRAKNSRAFWTGDWNLAELRRKIMMLDLPYPTDRDPPSIDFSVLIRAHAQPRTVAHTV